MKRILKKVLVIILVILMINNLFIIPVHAMDLGSAIGGLFSGVIGILTITYRVPAVMIGWLVNKFMVALAFAEGYTDPSYAPSGVVDSATNFLTIFDVLFDRIKLLSIDFFDIVDGDTSLVNQFRINVAAWFYIMRNVAAGILLVILIYIGIRMAISTIASDRAMYKRMLIDWTVSLVLIFVLNYIIIFTININKAIVSSMAEPLGSTSGSTSIELEAVMGKFGWKGMNPFGGISSIVTAVIYVMLIWQTAAIFFSYFNRMLKIAFLIIISPLISLTYSIDKIGDGKAQALDSWLKEFVFTVLIQPFHCAIYMCLISTSINVLIGLGGFNHISQTIGSAILSIVCITFTREAEKIVRKIFAFQDDNKSTSLVAGVAMASFAMNKAKSFGTGSVKAFNGAKNFLKDGKNSLGFTNMRAEFRAAKAYLSKDNSSENGENKDYATLRSEKRAELYEQKAEKLEKNFRAAQKGRGESEKIVAEARRMKNIENERQKIEDSLDGTMDSRELNAIARFNAAKKLGSGNGKTKENKNGSASKSKEDSVSKDSTKQDIKTTGDKVDGNSEDKINASEDKPKLFSNLRDAAMNDIKNFSMQETLQKSITRGSALFMGAGTYGVRGRVSEAVGAGVATYTAVNSMMKGLNTTYSRDIKKLAAGHSQKDEKEELLRNINSNSEDYDLSGDKIPDKLREIINELKNEFTGNIPDDSDIVNTITSNTENPARAISRLFGKDIKTIGPESALSKLQDYGIEYAISQKMSSANEVGTRPSQIISSIANNNKNPNANKEIPDKNSAIKYLEGKGADNGAVARRNLQLSKEFIVNPDSIAEEVSAVAPEQLEGVYRELGEIIKKREVLLQTLPDNTELKNKTEELERKRAELIKKAVQEIDVRNDVELEILQMKISRAANKVIDQFNSSEGTEEDRKKSIKALESLLGDLK